MPSQEQSASERTVAALASLKPIAKNVTIAANALSGPVMAVDAELKRLHIAFEAWTKYHNFSDDYSYTEWYIGYSRINGRWGIALRVVEGNSNESVPPEPSDQWHFNESPLYMRSRAIDKLPELLEALAKAGAGVAEKLNSAVERATEIAEIVSPKPKVRK